MKQNNNNKKNNSGSKCITLSICLINQNHKWVPKIFSRLKTHGTDNKMPTTVVYMYWHNYYSFPQQNNTLATRKFFLS